MKLFRVIYRSGKKRHRNIVEVIARDKEHARNKILSRHASEAKRGLEIVSIEPIRDEDENESTKEAI